MEDVVTGAWREGNVLVTGATGLLGGWLVQTLLDRGASVVALVRDGVPASYAGERGLLDRCTIVRGDITNLALIERVLLEYRIATICHLAAQTQVSVAHRGPYHTLEANVRGTYTILEAARRVGGLEAVVVASSDKAYGSTGSLPYVEDAPLLGAAPYDASKAAADQIARGYAVTYALPVTVARFANLFGGGDLNWDRLVPGTIRSLLRSERPIIRSDGTPVRDYLFVADAVTATIRLAEHASQLPGEAFNFGLEDPLTVLDMVDRIAVAVGTRLEPDIRNVATAEIPRQYLSATKARKVLGWTPSVALDDGLARTVEWYRSYLGQ